MRGRGRSRPAELPCERDWFHDGTDFDHPEWHCRIVQRGLAVKAADRWNTAVMPLQVLALMFAAGIVATGLVLRRRDSTGR